MHDPPCAIALQARPPHDLLFRTVDVRLRDDRAAVCAVVRQFVIHLRKDRRGKAKTDDAYPESKHVVHDRLLHCCPRPFHLWRHWRRPAHRFACARFVTRR
ncbi:hypothetical protein BSLA_03r0118 [Burkholderia stabilis]|nr:hypothetical protein BSLA_03r0118 [Burkholderia stabilis]